MITPFALTDITVLTGDADGTVHENWTVVVDASGTIEHAGPSGSIELGSRAVIDGKGKFVIPGLINAHAHLFSDGKPLAPLLTGPRTKHLVAKVLHSPAGRWLTTRRTKANAINQLHSGVTTIRSVGDVRYEVMAVRDAIERGDYLGPTILPSGPLLPITDGHGAPQISLTSDTPAQARHNTLENLRRGAQTIKISATAGVTDAKEVGYAGRPEMSEQAMRAVCEEAHAVGVIVAAHAQSEEGVLAALRAGVDTIEHGSQMSDAVIELFLDNPNSLRGYSAMIPTVQACLPLVELDQSVSGATDVVRENAKLVLDEMVSGIATCVEYGIAMGVGNDSAVSYVTHSNFWRELDFLVRYTDLDTRGVLHATTAVNAAILGIDSVTGSIEPGQSADLVVLEDNPLESFRNLESPWMVVVRGERIDHPQITRIPEIDEQLDTL